MSAGKGVLHGVRERLGFGVEAELALPTPSEAMTIGHAIHMVDDRTLAGTTMQRLANVVVKEYESIKTVSGTAEHAYLSSARGIINSYARALARRKQAWLDERKEATDAYNEKRATRVAMKRTMLGFRAAWHYVGAVAMAFAGYLIAMVISIFVPAKVAARTGYEAPSILAGFALIALWMAFIMYLDDYRNDSLRNEYDARIARADRLYAEGKLRDQSFAWQSMLAAWKMYSGENFPATLAYHVVAEADLHSSRQVDLQVINIQRQALRYLHRVVRRILRKKKNGNLPVSSSHKI